MEPLPGRTSEQSRDKQDRAGRGDWIGGVFTSGEAGEEGREPVGNGKGVKEKWKRKREKEEGKEPAEVYYYHPPLHHKSSHEPNPT